MRRAFGFPLIVFLVFLLSNLSYAGHWAVPLESPTLMHIAGTLSIEGLDAQVNDEVAVFDSAGMLIGLSVVGSPGFYEDVPINGDSASTSAEDEGAASGEALNIKVWSVSKSKEYSGGELRLAPTTTYAEFGYPAASLPLVFVSGHLEASPQNTIG